MTTPLWTQPRTILHDLTQLSAERARLEYETARAFHKVKETAETEFQVNRQKINVRHNAEREAVEKELHEARQQLAAQLENSRQGAEDERARNTKRITSIHASMSTQAEKEYKDAIWSVTTIIESIQNVSKEDFSPILEEAKGGVERIQEIKQEAIELLREWRQDASVGGEKSPDLPHDGELLMELQNGVALSEERFARLRALVLPRYFAGIRWFWLFVLLWGAATGLVLWQFPGGRIPILNRAYHWALVSSLASVLLGLAITGFLYAIAAMRTRKRSAPFWTALKNAYALGKRCQQQTEGKIAHQQAQLADLNKSKEKHERDMRKAEEKFQHTGVEAKERQQKELAEVEQRYQKLTAEARERHDQGQKQLEGRSRRLLAEIKERFEAAGREIHEKYTHIMDECQTQYERSWTDLAQQWRRGMTQVETSVQAVNSECDKFFPPWTRPVWDQWLPPGGVPSGMPFGQMPIRLNQIPNGIPDEPRLQLGPGEFSLPALLPLPNRCSLLLKAKDAGKAKAIELLQALMFRFLTSLPPGKVKFTILDPVGLGENFAAFMTLADYDDSLITNRIWTELIHIDQRLADLTEHIENVIQKYLRNQYQSIDEYNAQAGEVAEAFRVLVVANFPVNVSVDATRRLISIANSGARCGVYTLISMDADQPVPHGFNPDDLEQNCLTLTWKDNRFVWKDADFEKFPLQVQEPPPDQVGTRLLHRLGEKARDAAKVEVPFEFVVPPPEQWWTAKSSAGINVAVGRAGATKRQHLKLGKGTAQHVLIAGKTGSGKSTLMHALITNLALAYSPQEVELYLIDFKKGVEFKTYAEHQLPHAKVIAIESEREFGLSVLQRLDAELRIRGDRFRDLGVADLPAYRQANGDKPLPRIMLIVDEFQEFFVEEDKISQEVALLMDRLVRQGRAFGIHILLGSQTLGGAYSLARSTLDQMAVRIVLQCSEADGHLALSKDNSAARLLSRPGEAIYNDANGLLEGNNPFQVVWLSDAKHEEYLDRVRDVARQRNYSRPEGQIVFEGNAPADLDRNPLLHELLAQGPEGMATGRTARAWLGEAIAIKEPTAAALRPQSGSNMLILGQQEEPSLGIVVSSLISLAAHQPLPEGDAAGARFYVVDGSPPDSPHAGWLSRLSDVFAHPLRVGGWRDLGPILAEVAEEVDRRQKANEMEAPPVYLFIFGIQRFRDLRKPDDDFGFSRKAKNEAVSPAQSFGTIIKEGPGFGVFTGIWCDSLNNLNRALDRQGMREFELRILFQMSAADSSTLIDTPAASKLGMHRALFFTEEIGQPEKFRPYGLPTSEWLAWVKEQWRKKLAGITRYAPT